MKLNSMLIILCCWILFSNCSQSYEKATEPVSAGKEFLEKSKSGDFEKAELYLLKDEKNNEIFLNYKNYISKKSAEERMQIKNSSIIVNKVETINDSTYIINCQNSNERKPMELKLIKMNNEWWVDFKYTFSGNLTIE